MFVLVIIFLKIQASSLACCVCLGNNFQNKIKFSRTKQSFTRNPEVVNSVRI